MGVFHISGLGFSPGAFTVPFTYHVERLIRSIRLKEPDPFFALSGELSGQDLKGNIEGVVLITTPDVFYNKNKIKNKKKQAIDNNVWMESIKKEYYSNKTNFFELTVDVIRSQYKRITDVLGVKKDIDIFTVVIDWEEDFWKILKILAVLFGFLKGTGSLGKETWINFTAGNNTIQLALLNAISFHQSYARTYYYQVEYGKLDYLKPIGDFSFNKIDDPKPNSWVDIPVVTGEIDESRQAIIKLVNMSNRDVYLSEIKSQVAVSSRNLEEITRRLSNQGYIKMKPGMGKHGTSFEATSLGKKMAEFIKNKNLLLKNQAGGLNALSKEKFAKEWFKKVD
ncbi:MAG: hypothetical protein ACTSVI_13825 [Promethearchaeota archaeon]